MQRAKLIDEGDAQIVVFPSGFLEGVEDVEIEQRNDGSVLIKPVARSLKSNKVGAERG